MSGVLSRVPLHAPAYPSVLTPTLNKAARICVIGAAILGLGGCASQHASHPPAYRVAGPAPQQQWATKVEIEDDGLPAQLAPKHRRPTPDDPTEPWSPNYGTKPAAPSAPTKAAALVPAGERASAREASAREEEFTPPPSPSRRAPKAIATPAANSHLARTARAIDMDEDAIVRRAITEHEMRRQ